MANIFFFLAIMLGSSAWSQTRTEVVLDNTTFRITDFAGIQSFNTTFLRNQQQISSNYQYFISITNADGEDHIIPDAKDCTSLTHIAKLSCLAVRSSNLFYVNNIRVSEALISLNSVQLTSKSTFNKTTSTASLPLSNVSNENLLQIVLKGAIGSYIQVKISVVITNIDMLPPAVTANITPETLVNKPFFHVSIADQSSTITDVYVNEELFLSTVQKDFDVSLSEGVNNIVIRSKDENNNIAPDFILSSITLDTAPPAVSSNLKSNYFFNSLPNATILEFYPSEPLAKLLLNGNVVPFDADSGIFRIQEPITSEGPLSFELKAIDFAGNETVVQYPLNVSIDNIAPQITIDPVPPIIINNSYQISVHVLDDSSTITSLMIDSISTGPITEKDFSYLIDFPEDGSKTIVVSATDEAGNISTKQVTLTRNTAPFLAQVTSPINNTTVNTHSFEIEVSGNKPIQEVTINNVVYQVSEFQLKPKITVQMFSDGDFDLPILAKDIFGESFSTSLKIQISTNSLSSWNYLECPAE
jgi:hypothetical protein